MTDEQHVRDTVAEYVAAFTSGDAARLDALYEPSAILVPRPGQPLTGPEARLAAHRHLISFGVPMQATPRQTYITGDIALVVVDWTLHGTAAQGFPLVLQGTAADVLRRSPDGRWRYVIDNPFGTGA